MNSNTLRKAILKNKIKLIKIKKYKFNFDIFKDDIPRVKRRR